MLKESGCYERKEESESESNQALSSPKAEFCPLSDRSETTTRSDGSGRKLGIDHHRPGKRSEAEIFGSRGYIYRGPQ